MSINHRIRGVVCRPTQNTPFPPRPKLPTSRGGLGNFEYDNTEFPPPPQLQLGVVDWCMETTAVFPEDTVPFIPVGESSA